MKTTIFSTTLMGIILAVLAACGSKELASDKPLALFKATATIQEIMLSIIDPNVDFLWNSVATISTAAGTEERAPKTDAEWAAVRQHALVVLEATNLLVIEGRLAAKEGVSTSAAPAELSAKEIEKLIASNRGDFINYAHALHDSVQLSIKAIDAKNVEQLVEAGGAIEHACEQCHKRFWYPNDKLPSASVFTKKS